MLSVIDAHVHFWDPGVLEYPWLAGVPALKRSYMPRDYTAFANDSVAAAIFVEANARADQNLAEVELVEALVASESRIVGIVAFVDLREQRTRKATLRQLALRANVVGVRQNIQGHDPGNCLEPSFVQGIEEVGDRDLTFDLCATANQLGDVIELARRCPATHFVLDHCGKPAIRDDGFASWARDIERLAAHSHVACKVSGLLTEARADQGHADALRPYVEHVRGCFGQSRLIYGSDWPVVTLAGGVERWRQLVAELTAEWSTDDVRAFYADNAMRLYGIRHHVAH